MFDITQEKISEFKNVQTRFELTNVLGIKEKILTYFLYVIAPEKNYTEFEVKKKNGSTRLITVPTSGLKLIQKRLSLILLEIYPPKSCVHGYIKSKSILTNTKTHVNKRYLLNLDLENFFPSINFGRVRGLFQSYPFNFNENIATILAQICCYNNSLPVGAPTSPIISNFICRKLDNDLLKIATQNKSSYSRYADDITFSTNLKIFPECIGEIKEKEIILSKPIIDLIESNGFKINYSKVRLAKRNERQKVTGLIVNKFPNIDREYIRNVRAMIHAWERYGLSAAAKEHFNKKNTKIVGENKQESLFKKRIIGKVGFIGSIRGRDDRIYKALCYRIKKLDPEAMPSFAIENTESEHRTVIYGEGKTDWKHLKAALEKHKSQGLYTDLSLIIKEYTDDVQMNNVELLKMCQLNSKAGTNNNKLICIFDNDDKDIVKQVTEKGSEYKSWGGNVFSFTLPKPPHRNFNEVSIEHFYIDDELKKVDANGRRIFLADEFHNKSGRHKVEDLNYPQSQKLKKDYPFVIDGDVYDLKSENVALSKNDFANYILTKNPGFDNVTFEHFKLIFNIIQNIITQSN